MSNKQDEMKPEYDFTGKQGVRGKYYQKLRGGYAIKIHQADGSTVVQTIVRPEGTIKLDPDVQVYFPDSETVNTALRALIRLIPSTKQQSAPSQD